MEIGRNVQPVWSPRGTCSLQVKLILLRCCRADPRAATRPKAPLVILCVFYFYSTISRMKPEWLTAQTPLRFPRRSFPQPCRMKTGEGLTSLTGVAHVLWEYIYEYGRRKTLACEWVTGPFSCVVGFRRGALIVFCKSQQQDLLLQWIQTLRR